ncbi:MAG: hypothetical protein AMXMBFR58_15540 [Phycisphaerae bacterium]
MEQTRISAAEVVLSPGERVLFSVRPSPWMIVLRHLGWYAAMAGVLVLAWIASRTFLADLWGLVLGLWVVAVGARLLWDVLDWFFRCYTLTDRRVINSSGVLQRRVSDLPLERVQYLEATRLVRQRIVGVGTIAAGTSGLVVPEVIWAYVARWESVVAEVRREMERRLPTAIRGAGGDRAGSGSGGGDVIVVGLAGGIGSGKSTVGRMLGERGCVVLDSDAAAKEILRRAEVREELVRWWGRGILGPDGNVDRRSVAEIVFLDGEQRRRLEGLVHPLIKQQRDAVIERVRGEGGGIVVVDAPLLFEAGVDKECDAVVWVEASGAVRLGRVRERGWDEAELARRESAQWPVEEKRARATLVVQNDGGLAELERAVDGLMERLRGVKRVRGWGGG